MVEKSWFKSGAEGAAEGRKVDEEAARKRAESQDVNVISKKRRLWMPPDSSIEFTFLDTEGFFLREHQLFIAGSWINFETCLSDFDNCPLCDAGNKPSYIVAFTGIDHSEYTIKKGPHTGMTVKNTKRLAVFKSTARNKILKEKERNGDLRGVTFEISRYDSKDNSSGSDFHLVKKCTDDELKAFAPAMLPGKNGMEPVDPEEWIKPLCYSEVFAPKTARELLVIIGGVPPVGSDDEKIKPSESPTPSEKGDIGRFL